MSKILLKSILMAKLKGENQIEIQKRQAIRDGLRLAVQLKEKLISQEQFAKKFAKLRESVIFESLTGLFTPYFFEIELKREIAVSRRYGVPLCLMIIDLDKLKTINDTYGHAVGNKAILLLGKTILKHIREEDVPCRWGGDEFVVILPYTEVEEALSVASRIRDLVGESKIDVGKEKIRVSASIGIAKFAMLDTPTMLFKKADRAVYEVKRNGRGEMAIFDPEMMLKKGEKL